MVAGPAPRAARRTDRLAVHVALGVRGLSRAPRRSGRRRSTEDEAEAFRERNAYWLDGLARLRRHGRRPGAVRARVAGAARVRGRARRAPLRRHADLRRARTAPTTARIRSSSSRAPSPGCRPDLFADDRPAVGQPALRLDRDARRRLPLVDRALPPDVRARRPDAGRPLPRLRLLLGGARAASTTAAARPLAARPRRRASSTPCEPTLGQLAVVAEDLGVITEPVVRLRRELGFPGHGRAPVRARQRPDEPAPAREPPGAVGRLHRHARQRHDARLVGVALRRGPRVDGPRPGRSRRGR